MLDCVQQILAEKLHKVTVSSTEELGFMSSIKNDKFCDSLLIQKFCVQNM